MRHLLLLAFVCLFSLPLAAQDQDSRYWEGVVYFQLRPELNLKLDSYDSEKITRRPLSSTYKDFPQVLSVLENNQVQKLDQAFKSLSTPAAKNIYRLDFDNKENVASILKTLQGSSRIAYAERAPKNYTSALPNDAEIGRQWYLETIEAEAGWDLAVPQREVVVAVVDDAVSIEHEDLEANVWRNTTEINGTRGVDDDGNGYVDDFFGWDGAMNDNNPNPPSNANDQYFMHGTHVAGTVGAVTNNGRGIAAISNNTAKIMACKGARDFDGALSGIWEAFAYAVANNPDVISNSWGRGVDDNGNPPAPLAQFERALLDEAFQKGIIVLFAAGNENSNIAWPGAYDNVIAVASTGNLRTGVRDEKASYSNFGSWVDIAAPGSQIHSLSPGPSRYVSISGTSMATPNVASLVALMMSHAPSFNANQIRNCLLTSTDNIDATNPNFTGLLGNGRINVRKAIECVSNPNNQGCGIPTSLSVANLTNTEGTLTWNTVNGATGYNVEIRAVGNSNWFSFQENPFPSNQVNVRGMTEGTRYEFRVQAVCGQSLSAFSSPFSFQTTGGENPVGNACVSYNTLYNDFINGGNCANNPISVGFQVWTNEGYQINSCVPGQTYTFSICNGYNPNTWTARLTAALLDENNAPTNVLATIEGCELSFTIPADFQSAVNVVVVVADANDCGGGTRQIDNGTPTLSCAGNATPCLSFNSLFTDFSEGGNCSNTPIVGGFEVWTNEAYRVNACIPGQTYTFSFCDGYNPANWQAQLTAAILDNSNMPADILESVDGCELSFTIPANLPNPVNVVLIVADKNNCGGATQEIDNGVPSLTCTSICSAPTSLRTTDISDNEAILAWNGVNGSDSYTVQARQTGAQEWLEAIGFTETSIRFFDLSPCTEYEFRVRTQCGSDVSEFTEPFRFTTEGCQPSCPSPTNVSVSTDGQQATISWTGDNTLDEYIVNYRHKAAVTWLTRSTAGTSLTLDTLTNCLTYEYQVIGVCETGQESITAVDTFDIDCLDCTPPNNINFVATTPFNTNIVWDAKPIDLRYVVEAKPASSSDWIQAEIQDNAAFYSGLDPCNTYDVRIKAVCTSGESNFSAARQVTTEGCSGPVYCNSQGENSRFEWIEKVEIGNLSNQSGDDAGYRFFDELVTPSLGVGDEVSLTLTPGFLEEIYEEYWGIWIDLNQDGDFDDANENVFNSDAPSSSPIAGSFILPAGGSLGQTTMRVAMKYFESSTDADRPQACTTFEFGEVEDYQVNLVAGTTSTLDLEAGKNIKVFPNPFEGLLQVEGLEFNHKLRVVDVLGRTVYQLAEGNGGKETSIDLSKLDSGVYIFEVRSDDTLIYRKKISKY